MSAVTRTIRPGVIRGSARIPASKSHTIRALLIATLADGRSVLRAPLDSLDTAACVRACRALGAGVEEARNGEQLAEITVEGTGGTLETPEDVIDVGNSGTTLYLGIGTAALADGLIVFTGDDTVAEKLSAIAGTGDAMVLRARPPCCDPETAGDKQAAFADFLSGA